MLGIRTKIRHVSASLKWAKANEHNRTQLGRWTIGLDNVTIGDYSYGEINVLTASKQPKLAIGELCSIAPNVTFVIHNNHPIDHFTTFLCAALSWERLTMRLAGTAVSSSKKTFGLVTARPSWTASI